MLTIKMLLGIYMNQLTCVIALLLISPFSTALTIVKDYPSNCELNEYLEGSSTRDFKFAIEKIIDKAAEYEADTIRIDRFDYQKFDVSPHADEYGNKPEVNETKYIESFTVWANSYVCSDTNNK